MISKMSRCLNCPKSLACACSTLHFCLTPFLHRLTNSSHYIFVNSKIKQNLWWNSDARRSSLAHSKKKIFCFFSTLFGNPNQFFVHSLNFSSLSHNHIRIYVISVHARTLTQSSLLSSASSFFCFFFSFLNNIRCLNIFGALFVYARKSGTRSIIVQNSIFKK